MLQLSGVRPAFVFVTHQRVLRARIWEYFAEESQEFAHRSVSARDARGTRVQERGHGREGGTDCERPSQVYVCFLEIQEVFDTFEAPCLQANV